MPEVGVELSPETLYIKDFSIKKHLVTPESYTILTAAPNFSLADCNQSQIVTGSSRSLVESSNMKSSENLASLRLTACFKAFVLTS